MAIRFVDVKPDDEAEGAKPAARRPRAPEATPEPGPALEAADAPVDVSPGTASGDGDQPLPTLPHAKPEPKPRGRKKPMSAVGSDKAGEQRKPAGARADDAPSAPLLEGLLPELQAHAKPTPKPRGRKKAFG